MTVWREKLSLIFLPFLFVAIAFIIVYTFLHWLLIIKTGLLSIKEIVVEYWLPVILVWIPVLIWVRPRIKLLEFRKDSFGLLFFCTIVISVPCIVLQFYLNTATGSLTQLKNINEITKLPASKYYRVNEYFIDKQRRGLVYNYDLSGKRNQYLNLHIYIACPVYGKEMEPVKIDAIAVMDTVMLDTKKQFNFPSVPVPYAWYCIHYRKQISNKLSTTEEKRLSDLFYDESMEEFRMQNLNNFVYLKRTGNNDERAGYKRAIQKSGIATIANEMNILEPVAEPFSERNGNKLLWSFLTLVIGLLIFLFILEIMYFDEIRLERFKAR